MPTNAAPKVDIDLQPLATLLANWPDLKPRNLIAVLQRTQDIYGYLPMPALDEVARLMRVAQARVFGVATFYSQFRLEPQGEHVIRVCNGTACNVKGGEGLLDELVAVLGIRPGETTEDGKISLEQVACVGACGVAPAVVVDGEVHGRMTPKSIRKLADKLLAIPAGTPRLQVVKSKSDPAHTKSFLSHSGDICETRAGSPCPEFFLRHLEGKSGDDDPTSARYQAELSRLATHQVDTSVAKVAMCRGLTCDAAHGPGLRAAFDKELAARGLTDNVEFVDTGCQGLCEVGPIVQLGAPLEAFYCRVKPDDVAEIIDTHIKGGKRVERLLYAPESPTEATIPFYQHQVRRVLSNCGKIDPENIDEYIARGGYKSLLRALRESTPDKIIALVTEAGLRGRGGGGFPTGKKWAAVRAQPDTERYLICNADEGDPGAFMDRSVLEGDPHRVLEGMLIGAYAMGVQHAFIYCRAEYPLAIRRLEIAIEQARMYGLVGQNILGANHHLELEIVQGAGAFVCGEETAMIASIEGKRGMAVNKPPYPAQAGFARHPTCVNNVETFANIPLIVEHGAAWFREVGTAKSPGTKIFSLSGKVRNTGLVEVPIGITARELIHVIGGGATEGSTIKAAQTGGPSGGCIPGDAMDVVIDYESLKAIGSMMGSGGLVVTDSGTCMVAFAKFFLSFTQHESCGKCIPCREGTKRMLEILERITGGKGSMRDLAELKHLAVVIQRTSACGLGQSAPNPVLSTIRYFEQEYLGHIRDLKCLAGVCKSLLTFRILDNCRGCGLCARHCPVQCISGNKGEIYQIDYSRCTKCAQCHRVCPFAAVART